MGDQIEAALGEIDASVAEAAEKPAETVAPEPKAAPEPKPAAKAESKEEKAEVDRSANWRKFMDSVSEHVPEELKHEFSNRVDQGTRWGRGDSMTLAETKAISEKFAEVSELAEQLAPTIENGQGYLEEHGPAKFLKAYAEALNRGQEPEPEPEDDPANPEVSSLMKRMEQLEKTLANKAQEEERAAAKQRLNSDLTPLIRETVGGWNIADAEAREKVTSALMHYATLQYFSNAWNKPAGTSTPARAAKEVAEYAELLYDAMSAKKAKKAAPKVEAVPKVEKKGSKNWEDTLDEINTGFAKDYKKVAEEIIN